MTQPTTPVDLQQQPAAAIRAARTCPFPVACLTTTDCGHRTWGHTTFLPLRRGWILPIAELLPRLQCHDARKQHPGPLRPAGGEGLWMRGQSHGTLKFASKEDWNSSPPGPAPLSPNSGQGAYRVGTMRPGTRCNRRCDRAHSISTTSLGVLRKSIKSATPKDSPQKNSGTQQRTQVPCKEHRCQRLS